MRIYAVTFDCWGTLLLDGPQADERYKEQRLAAIDAVLKTYGLDFGRTRLSLAYEASARILAHAWKGHRDLSVGEQVNAILEALDPRLVRRIGPRERSAMLSAYAGAALLAPPAVDRGARKSLEWLAERGAAIAVISNTMRTPGEVLGQVLAGAGLPPFKALTFSDECGVRKPDPDIFRLTLRKIGITPDLAVHVGDDPVLDVEGAREAGMAVIQVTPDGRATAPVKPHAVIRGLRELPAALERLASTRVA
jgi:putative hydrolase of the HAD superfamily